jgi:inorganic pyrophosphatase
VNAYIEIVPTDVVKYELDKPSGHLRLDRPQRYSSLCPTPYGFIPQTYCGDSVGELCSIRTGVRGIKGDGDPIDICVLTEKSMAHGNFFVRARPIGGLRMIDGVEADDKIIAVLESDVVYGQIQDISQVPAGLIDRLKHYFLSYKQLPNEALRRVEIADVYNRAEAAEAIRRSVNDYRAKFGPPEERMGQLRQILAQ